MTSLPRPRPMPSATPPPMPGVATADWPELAAELDRWGEAGRVAKLWWRDDDAIEATPELAALLRIAGATPFALAVVPAFATATLAAALRDAPSCMVLQHGWRHIDRAIDGKKSEYPSGVPASVVAAEIAAGRERLAALFGRRALPVFVPPWNRIAPELLPVLADAGMAALSSIASPQKIAGPAGLGFINTHTDLTNWKDGRQFIGEASALGSLIAWLRRNRLDNAVTPRALGILTHHLIMDRETAGFLERLVRLIAEHPATRWVDIAEMLR